ncbi:MAG: MarR family transcriptional regulator [Nocardioidaceae bacterium]|nr:MarR family transcriptional regulator [Nocardioidaceae bacterium]MCL2612945.1 MarR family transcriptional regulator [Nocardioidaceae bacterium]
MSERSPLPFDPIERAADLWSARIGDASGMRLATSIMRVQQLLIARLDRVLRPMGITFARYEVLVLLSFSRTGQLPLSRIGERLMVHPTSVTNAIDRLVEQGLVRREVDAADRRRVLASLTTDGKRVLRRATAALMEIDFGVGALDGEQREQAYDVLRLVRAVDFEE